MADVGARIEVTTTGTPRTGVVIAVSGAMLTVRWDNGGETSLIPGPGDLTVVTGRRRYTTPPSTSKSSGKKVTGRPRAGKKAVADWTVTRRPKAGKAAKSRPATQASTGKAPTRKEPVAKKAVSAKKTAGRKMPTGKKTATKKAVKRMKSASRGTKVAKTSRGTTTKRAPRR
jgi:hypothetical protein